MARSKHTTKRKITGGRYISMRTKRRFELAGTQTNTHLSDTQKHKGVRTLGGNTKQVTLSGNLINLTIKGKTQKTQILNVIENPANPHLVRRNIMTRGAIVETSMGKARITSRPGQEGTMNGVLLI